MHVRLALIVHADAADERHDLSFLIELDFLLAEAALRIRPAENSFVDRAEAGEVGVLDLVLLGEFREAGHDLVALGHVHAERPAALTEIGDTHPGREPFSWSSTLRNVTLRRCMLGCRRRSSLSVHIALDDERQSRDQEK